ncbi:MAG TPA: hypothetical protein VJR02_20305 [Pyrinomonadaceae bacterium]|nr:hypothetical protein [Pyrinomonadaceae bacterium]
MSARSSRLHALERGLKSPRKSRAKARGLSVMRLESGAAPVQSGDTRPARLPKDMEDQIAIVRGHAVGKPSRGLLELEQRLLQPRDAGPTSPAIQRHDHSATPVSAAPLSQARALSAQIASREFGGHYNVESFEDTSTITAPRVPTSTPEYKAGTTPGTISTPTVPTVPPPGVTPCAEPHATISPRAVPETPERTRRTSLDSDQEAVAANFERDISAMLGTPSPVSPPENQQWDDAVRNATTAPTATPVTPAIATPQPAVAPKQDQHEVFNQMGLAMNYANSFDLGTMDISARFDRFDEELALAPSPTMPTSAALSSPPLHTSVQALALDDFDLVEDLAEISAAQPCPIKEDTPAAIPTPASPVTTERTQS